MGGAVTPDLAAKNCYHSARDSDPANRPMILPCFLLFISGFSALIYETVWTRWLVLVFGATVHSASVVLAGFMAGMAGGAWAGALLARRPLRPLRVYGFLELGVAAAALLFPSALGALSGFMETTALPLAPARAALSLGILFVPSALMGATFPVLSRLSSGSDPGKQADLLYGANLLGACLGVLGGAFFLLPHIGLSGAHRLAVLLSAAAGATAVFASGSASPPVRPSPARIPAPAAGAAFASGICAMAFEIVWIRILTPSFNNSAYGFASVLFVFLGGFGLGSWAASRGPAPNAAVLGGAQLLAGLYAYLALRGFEVTQLIQIKLDTMAASSVSPVVLAPLLEAAILLGPLALIQGFILPAAVRLGSAQGGTGEAAGRLVLWNTAGAVLGALGAGFWLIPVFGAQGCLLAVATAAAACGALMIGASRWGAPGGAAGAAAVLAAAALARTGFSGTTIPEKVLLDWLNRGGAEARLEFYREDLEASVAVKEQGGSRHLIINTVGVAGYNNATKMMAHIPLSLHPAPRRVLVICFGMGTTFRSALSHPVRVDAVELVPSVFSAFPLFYPDAARAAADPRARLIVNDGRNHLLREREGYDVVIVDPSPPLYAAGTVNLYSRDFFSLALRRLRPGGLLAVWLLETPETEFKMVLNSFLDVMPHSQVWLGAATRGGVILMGSRSPIPLDPRRAAARLARPGVRTDILELNREFSTPEAFWRLYLGPGSRFSEYAGGAPLVTDDFPRIEYPYFRAGTPAYLRHPSALRWDPVRVP